MRAGSGSGPARCSALHPAAAERDGLPDEEIAVLAGEKQREAGVLFRRGQTAERDLAFQRCLKGFSGLELLFQLRYPRFRFGGSGLQCAVAVAAATAGLRCIIHIPERYHTRRLQEMVEQGAEIVRVEGDYECSIEVSRELAVQKELYDANPGGTNSNLQLRTYGEIANEIYDELRDAPRAVAVPVSNGTTLAGVYKGFLSLYRRGKTSRIPMMIAGSSWNKNSIVESFLKMRLACEDLHPNRIRETSINEPLINWHSADGDPALEAIRKTRGWAANASDRVLTRFARLIREKEGLNVLPASTAGLVALVERHRSIPLESDRYVVILTGRRE